MYPHCPPPGLPEVRPGDLTSPSDSESLYLGAELLITPPPPPPPPLSRFYGINSTTAMAIRSFTDLPSLVPSLYPHMREKRRSGAPNSNTWARRKRACHMTHHVNPVKMILPVIGLPFRWPALHILYTWYDQLARAVHRDFIPM